MVPQAFVNYFLGSSGASAALIGLLFVAVSIAPERVFGEKAHAEQRAVAVSAFLALLNAFFVSLVALIPTTNIGYVALVMAVTSLISTARIGRGLWDERHEGRAPGIHRLTLLGGSLVIYGMEIGLAVALIGAPHHTGYVYGLAYLLLGAYGLGIGRAWELLGARNEGLFTLLHHVRGDDVPDSSPEEPR
jgi:hypothetical protein